MREIFAWGKGHFPSIGQWREGHLLRLFSRSNSRYFSLFDLESLITLAQSLWNTGIFLHPVVVQLPSHVQLFATLWTVTHQASLSLSICRSLPKFMSIESVMPSNHLILCYPLLLLPSIFPTSGSFPVSWLFTSGGHSIGASASASVLPMNIQG